jgi:hypothetical protein
MKLRVFASLVEDLNQGWVWLPEKTVSERAVVKIKNLDSGKVIYCEALQLGENYLHRYNTNDRTFKITDKNSTIVANEWYRRKLQIENTYDSVEFDISKCENPYGHLRACLDNPQIVIRLATELGIISVILGLISLTIALG